MYTAINSAQIDQDFNERDIDPGDFKYCNDCGEWVIPSKITEPTEDHKLLTIYTCTCGSVLLEEI